MTNIIDLFAGPGGWDQGLKMLGREDVLGVEWDRQACETATAAGHRRVQADVARLSPLEVAKQHVDGALEGLVASPPCQGFSTAGLGGGREDSDLLLRAIIEMGAGEDLLADLRPKMRDARSALVLEPLRWTLELEPDWVAWEQVPPVLPLWEACAETLRGYGYNAWAGNVHAEQYGVPQTRKRAVLIAHRQVDVGRPAPTHSRYHSRTPDRLDQGVEKWVSMAEALGWDGVDGEFPRWVDMDVDGEKRINNPSGTVINLDWVHNRPAATVVGRNLLRHPKATANRFNGSTMSRDDAIRLTVAEAAVLQSFPADYPFAGHKGARFRQVGDAVPPLLAAHVLNELGV